MKAANWHTGFGLLAALVILPTSVGAWLYEQIEGPGNWGQVELEVMPTGMTCIFYYDGVSSGHYVVAHKDSIWHRDDIGHWTGSVGRHLVKGPAGKPAVLLESDTVTVYTVLTDTGWNFTTVHCTTGYSFLAFDSSGTASLVYYYVLDPGIPTHGISTAREQGGVWAADTLELGYHDALWWRDPICPTTFVLGPGNRFYDDRGHFVGYTMGNSCVYVDTGRTGAWGGVFSSQGRYASAVALSPGPASDFALCYNSWEWGGAGHKFYCNSDTVETLAAGPGKVRIDSRDIRQIVYRCGVMKLAYRTGGWHKDTLPPEINAASSFDFAVDAEDMPLIAFSSADGIFLASGDMVGIAEKPSQVVREPLRLPTIVRGVIQVDSRQNTAYRGDVDLLDVGGRRVARLHEGANDVSRLAPGAYFTRLVNTGIPTIRRIVVLK
jgi:hypothetical protein